MKRIITLLVAAVMMLTLCIPAFAAETPKEEAKEYYPIEGSWKLNTVFNLIDGEEPEEIREEEAQSLYGTGINIFTFDEDGYAHDMLFAGPDSLDTAAQWKTTKPNVYVYTEEGGMEITFTYEEEKDVLHRDFEIPDEDAVYKKLDFVYARAVVGSWKLDQVLEIHEGDAPVEMKKEENQSLYAEAENVLTFEVDGKVKEVVKDGSDETTQEGAWEMPEPDKFVYTIDTLETEMEYFRVDDTLFRDVKTEGEYVYLRFIYVRTEDPEKDKTSEAAAAQMPASPEEESLIADGQIFTGNKMENMVNASTGEYVVLSELNQGGWADEETGEIFHWEIPQDGDPKAMFGDRDTVLVIDTVYDALHNNDEYYEDDEYYGDDELINDGQIFTGNKIYYMVNTSTGEHVVLSELSQGGWADEETGEIFHWEIPQDGDPKAMYGDRGTVLMIDTVYDALYNNDEEEFDGGYAGINYSEEDYSEDWD